MAQPAAACLRPVGEVTHHLPDASTESSVLLLGGQPLLTQCLARALAEEGFTVTELVPRPGLDILGAARDVRPRLVVLDLDSQDRPPAVHLVPPLAGLGHVVLLNGTGSREEAAECLAAGAVGVVSKERPFDELVWTLRQAARGGALPGAVERDRLLAELWERRRQEHEQLGPFATLTRAEQDVLAALMDGHSTTAIAEERVVSPETVRSQVKAILRKLDVGSQLAAVALARSTGWVPAPSR